MNSNMNCVINTNKKHIKGNLSRNIDAWRVIGSEQFVMDMVKNGLKLPFVAWPMGAVMKNNKSALENSDFVDSKVSEFLNEGFVKEVVARPIVVNPLSVRLSSGKLRFILDLGYVNEHLPKYKFKLDNLKIALTYIERVGL